MRNDKCVLLQLTRKPGKEQSVGQGQNDQMGRMKELVEHE